jgi:CDP-diacylglycerol--serine O-phosphatidyltransferase
VYLLPNLFTTASLFSGFLAMLWAASGKFEHCALAILFSAVMDALDGQVARLTNTASDFGVQYDSLCDLAAFGVAPAIMIYYWQLMPLGGLGIGAAFLFLACGALRLARFNAMADTSAKKHFVGMPIPGAACCLATLVLFYPHAPDFLLPHLKHICLVFLIILAVLMVSRVRYASLKEYGVLKAHPFRAMVALILLFACIIAEPRLLGFLLCLTYVITGLVHTFIVIPRRSRRILGNPT